MSTPATLTWFMQSAAAARSTGAWEEALAQYETSLTLVAKEGDAGLAAEILRGIGNVHWARGDLENASEVFAASLHIAEAGGLTNQTASALNCLAVVEQFCGSIDEAEALYGRAIQLAEEMGDERRAVMIEQNLGTLASVRGDLELALRRYEKALERYERLEDHDGAARVLSNMGMAWVDLEAWLPAARCFDDAARRAGDGGAPDTLASIDINRAEYHLRRGEHDQARAACDRAFELYSARESKAGIAEACKFYGAIYRETGKLHLAATHLALALELARLCRDRLLEAEVEREKALVQLDSGQDRESLASLNRAHRLFAALGATRELLDTDRRLDQLETTYLEAARRWAEAVDAKDHFARGHSGRVSDHACLLGEAVGLEGRNLAGLCMAALLHDIGKVDVPDEVLNRPHALSRDDWRLIRSHPERGDRIIAEMDFPWDIRPIVRGHHERWDGTGYPDGLVGEQIPLGARIVAIAEVYDTLTTERSYSPALPVDAALAVMQGDSGARYDPRLFAAFRDLVGREEAGRPRETRFARSSAV